MKLPFLYEHLQKSSIDNKKQILEDYPVLEKDHLR